MAARRVLGRDTVRLANFIVRDMENVVANWEAFAATRVPAAMSMDRLELRSRAQQILEAIALDLSASVPPGAER
jgi:hypothetical protein